MHKQLALSVIDMRPICPVCKRPADMLGQYEMWSRYYLCRECTERFRLPDDIYEVDPRPTKAIKNGGWRISTNPDMRGALAKRIEYGAIIREAARKRPAQPPRSEQYLRWLYEARMAARFNQMEIPVCNECGIPYPLNEMGHQRTCPVCDAKRGAEALFTHRGGPFEGITDIEEQLDKLFKTFPRWFECGVLPDYWYELYRRSSVKN